jgi:hypothetical protein
MSSWKQNRWGWRGITVMAVAAAVMMLTARAEANTLRRGASAGASGSAGTGTFLSGYFDIAPGPAADNVLRLENPTAANGNLCAMIYIFNAAESMGECCGCLLTPNQLLQDSVKTVLGAGWGFSGGAPGHGVIQIVSALPNNGRQCVPYQPYTPTPTLNGWTTHAQTIGTVTGLTEVALTDNGAADPTEAASLLAVCGSIIGNGSGSGSCTCPKSEEVIP